MARFDATTDLNDRLAHSVSRREVLRRLGGAGLVAAGAVALRPALAAAASISNAFLSIPVSGSQAEVRVSATLNFTAADLKAMRNGQKFHVNVEVWENDNNNQAPEPGIDQFVFGFPRETYSRRRLPSSAEPFLVKKTVLRSSLDLDQPNPNGDEIVARLILTTPTGTRITSITNLVKLCPCQP